jgi:hypothetical protein
MMLCGRLAAVVPSTGNTAVDTEGKQTARKIDRLSRKLFPACFVAFNLIYWTVYSWFPFKADIDVA